MGCRKRASRDLAPDVWLRQPPPEGEGDLFCNKLRATGYPVADTTHHEPRTKNLCGGHTGPHQRRDVLQVTSHKLQATCRLSPIPRTRPDASAEIRGPCRTSRQDSVAVVPFAPSSRSQRVACYGPSRHLHHTLRTTQYEPAGRTHGSAPTTRHTASHEQRLQATSYRLLTAVSSFQPSESMARASQSRPAKSPSLVETSRNNGDEQRTTMTKQRPNPDHRLGPGPQLSLG